MTIAAVDLSPVVLEGRRVRLEPLDLNRHWEGLVGIGLEPELWRWTLNRVESPANLRDYLETAVREHAEGRSLPFATVDRASGKVAGSTRFSTFDLPNRRCEIGWTWIGREFRRSHVNTEAKYLMLRHGFEAWGLKRIELKTHEGNERSRNAMLRIGCTFEGILRNYQTGETGTRNSAMFSIVDSEWPAVKSRLENMMENGTRA